ncbi:hypothetical protein HQ403_01870 [Candidatus Kaiserbacteria bacterium]|nr:hypothetical protein [Candidatus Kaiserbacteria bacterium]
MQIKNLKFGKESIFVLLLLLFIGTLLTVEEPLLDQNKDLLMEYSTSILEICAQDEYRPTCYDREIPKLMDQGLSMEEAFDVTRFIQDKDEVYFYCHVLGHYLSGKETAKDPSKWKDVIIRVPSGVCSNGGIHGAFQERFRSESLPDADVDDLKPILADICRKRDDWDPTPMEQATCTHAIGHLTMYVTDADIDKSIKLCDEVSINERGRDFTQLCYDGAFMQIFQPLDPEDFGLVEDIQPTKEELHSFCWSFEGRKRSSCWSEGWPLVSEEIKEPEGVVAHCSQMSKNLQEENRCYSALFYVLGAQFGFDKARVIDFCSRFLEERKGQCFANGASRMIEIDWSYINKAVSICTAAEEKGVGDACYDELLLYSSYNFIVGSESFLQLCDGMPDPWRKQCLAQDSR